MTEKDELVAELDKLKKREKDRKTLAKREGEKLMGTVISVGSAAGGAFLIGSLAKTTKESDEFKSADEERQQEMLAEATSLGGIDYDAIIGGLALVAGVGDMVGDFSETSRQAGIGLISGWLGRFLYARSSQPGEATE